MHIQCWFYIQFGFTFQQHHSLYYFSLLLRNLGTRTEMHFSKNCRWKRIQDQTYTHHDQKNYLVRKCSCFLPEGALERNQWFDGHWWSLEKLEQCGMNMQGYNDIRFLYGLVLFPVLFIRSFLLNNLFLLQEWNRHIL